MCIHIDTCVLSVDNLSAIFKKEMLYLLIFE